MANRQRKDLNIIDHQRWKPKPPYHITPVRMANLKPGKQAKYTLLAKVHLWNLMKPSLSLYEIFPLLISVLRGRCDDSTNYERT